MTRTIMVVNPNNAEKERLHKRAEKVFKSKIPKKEFYKGIDLFFRQHGRYPENFSVISIKASKDVNVVIPVGNATAVEYKVDKKSRKHRKDEDVTYRHKMDNVHLVTDVSGENFFLSGDVVMNPDGWMDVKKKR